MNKLNELEANAARAIDFMSSVVVVPLDIAKKIVAQLEAALCDMELAWDERAEKERLALVEVAQLEAGNERLRKAIQRALDDEESGVGWGPDITVCGYLKEALKAGGE